ncbi:MAG: hypothetical protein KIT82_19645 [Bradyrhizobium sp.]|nr:hypothetical protein [Bradyrhizobium sp.]
MSEKPFRKPSALKHGAFSKIILLPWEDPKEFEALRCDLYEYFQPEGSLEKDAVNTILKAMWAKRRVADKRLFDTTAQLDRVQNQVLWEDPPAFFDTKREALIHRFSNLFSKKPEARPAGQMASPQEDYSQLLGFSSRLYGDTSPSILKLMIGGLPPQFAAHLEAKVPLDNFESSGEWAFALKQEVDNVLLPKVRGQAPPSDGFAIAASEFLTVDRILEDQAIEERLDVQIDRATQRLNRLKMGRQLYAVNQSKVVKSKNNNQIEYVASKTVESEIASEVVVEDRTPATNESKSAN